jgi:outer membrane protein OmpA-like peptidoglycan-associated protein
MAISLTTKGKVVFGTVLTVLLVALVVRVYQKGYLDSIIGMIAPSKAPSQSVVPEKTNISNEIPDAPALPASAWKNIPRSPEDPRILILSATWQTTTGLNAAVGGNRSTDPNSLCNKAGLTKVEIQIQNDVTQLGPAMIALNENPNAGANFIWYTNDTWAQGAGDLNKTLAKYGDRAVVVMSCGFSYGEDCLMGPPEWLNDPQKARGSVIVGQIRGCDYNVTLKWAGDNGIPVNPNQDVYDPDAINFEDATDHIVAAQKFVTNQTVSRRNKNTGQTQTLALTGCATWTPGDVAVFKGRPGTVKICSTRDYRSMMAHMLVGSHKWMSQHREATKTLLRCVLRANDLIKSDPQYRDYAMRVNAAVFNEPDKDAAYWGKYFQGVVESVNGVHVLLGGSRVNNLEDNLVLFGLKGSTNIYSQAYTEFGKRTVELFPDVLKSFPPAEQVADLSYLKEIARDFESSSAEQAEFKESASPETTVSSKAYTINFKSGSADFTPDSLKVLEQLKNDLVLSSGLYVQIEGHTDNQGDPNGNIILSTRRAEAVYNWLAKADPVNIPKLRLRPPQGFGASRPIASNDTEEGRTKNRRVQITLLRE